MHNALEDTEYQHREREPQLFRPDECGSKGQRYIGGLRYMRLTGR